MDKVPSFVYDNTPPCLKLQYKHNNRCRTKSWRGHAVFLFPEIFFLYISTMGSVKTTPLFVGVLEHTLFPMYHKSGNLNIYGQHVQSEN